MLKATKRGVRLLEKPTGVMEMGVPASAERAAAATAREPKIALIFRPVKRRALIVRNCIQNAESPLADFPPPDDDSSPHEFMEARPSHPGRRAAGSVQRRHPAHRRV